MDPNLLTILEGIKAQLSNLGQKIDMIENDYRDGDCQSSPHQEDKVFRNHDHREDDDQYLKNIKLDVLNFDGHLDPQYYLDWVMSLEDVSSGMRCLKSDEFALLL